MEEKERKELRALVRTMYDYQAMRIVTANRLRMKADETLMDEEFMDDAEISEKDYDVIEYTRLNSIRVEKRLAKEIKKIVNAQPIWKFFEKIDGISYLMAGVLISEFDINIAETVSKMWQFSGLNSGMVRGKKIIETTKKTDLSKFEVIRKFKNKNGGECAIILTDTLIRGDRKISGYICPYNAWLRTKLCGVIADNFIKSGLRWEVISEEEYEKLPEDVRDRREKVIDGKKIKDVPCKIKINSPYVQIWFDYKMRLKYSEKTTTERVRGGSEKEIMWKDTSSGHRHNAAKRYMIKMFLIDLYAAWRKVMGLSVREPYQEEKLGHKHTA